MPTKAAVKLTWAELNRQLKVSDEKQTEALLERVRKENKSPQFIVRVMGRLNKLRSLRNTREVLAGKR